MKPVTMVLHQTNLISWNRQGLMTGELIARSEQEMTAPMSFKIDTCLTALEQKSNMRVKETRRKEKQGQRCWRQEKKELGNACQTGQTKVTIHESSCSTMKSSDS